MWKQIDGYEGYYEVSDTGRVRSVDRVVSDIHGRMISYKGHEMKLTSTKARSEYGYLVVNLRKKHTCHVVNVHKLVANAFIPNPDCLPTINHKDGDKQNNNVSNLEWCSYRDNNIHALEHGLRSPRGNIIIQYSITGDYILEFPSTCEAYRQTGVSVGSISHCLNHRTHTAGGYVWVKKSEGATTI